MRLLKRFGIAAVATIAFGGSIFSTSAASAGTYPLQVAPYQYLPDSTDHWYCFDASVPSGSRSRYTSAMNNLDAVTLMSAVYTPTCGTSTDIRYLEASPIPYFSGTRGVALCTLATGYLGLLCDHYDVIVDPGQVWVDNGGFAGDPTQLDTNLHKTIRHETGHTAGLTHTQSVANVMISGQVTNLAAYLQYRDHDICHINLWFAYASLDNSLCTGSVTP